MKLKKVFVISMPIGTDKNCFKDVTLRGLEALKQCDAVVGENFIKLKKILDNMEVTTEGKDFFSVNRKNEKQVAWDLALKISEEHESVCVVADAGAPVVADVGYHLISAFRQLDISIQFFGGECAILTALVQSGFYFQSFVFAGFLSRDINKKRIQLQSFYPILNVVDTIVIFEAPYRLKSLLRDVAEIFTATSSLEGALCFNLTEKNERIENDTVAALHKKYASLNDVKKENFVLVLHKKNHQNQRLFSSKNKKRK